MNAATLASFMKRSILEILSRGTKTMSPACSVRSFSKSLVRRIFFRFSSLTSAVSELILRNTTTCEDLAVSFMLSGGMKETARSSQVVVFRKINSDTAEVKLLNLKNIRRTSDLENDLTLQAGDMVFVPRDKISKIERFMKLANVAAFIAPKL